MKPAEIQFAKGEENSETERMRVTYATLDRLHPHARYPVIHKSLDAGGEQSMTLTPGEAQWLLAVLDRLLRES